MSETGLPSAEDLVGQTVAGRFDVVSLLGQGGMGAVYEATQQPLGRRVALKVIKRALTDDPVAVKRFTTEAQAVAQMSHPHIVTVHDFGQSEDGKLFIAMEFLEGESVRERLQAGGAIPWQKTLPVVTEVCEALVAAHELGIIHRDLKPDNVMLVKQKGRDDYVKVVDFGVAKLLEVDASASKLTSTGMAVGTPGYISPEQIDGITDDPRSDLYALGVLWFEMLTGQSPFSAATPVKLVLEHMTKPAPRPSEVAPNAGVPPEIDQLVQRLMGKAPEGRAQSTAALVAELEAVWGSAKGLPPDAATAGLDTGEVHAVRAAASASQDGAVVATPGTPSSPIGSPVTPSAPGGLAPAGTPATGAVAASAVAPTADGVQAPAPPQKKRSLAQWAGIGCLLFFVAPVSTCAMCVAVSDGPKFNAGDEGAGVRTYDFGDFTGGGPGAVVTARDGKSRAQLPKLGDPDADRLMQVLAQAMIDGDDVALQAHAASIGDEPSPEQEEALEVVAALGEQLQAHDAGPGAAALAKIEGEDAPPAPPVPPVPAASPEEEPKKSTATTKRATRSKKRSRKSAAERRDEKAEKLAREAERRAEEAERRAEEADNKREKRKKKRRRFKNPLDRLVEEIKPRRKDE